jgi:tetratricopeptide (TPR) repeat protein
LEEAVSATLLLEAGSDSYTFSHALTQRALYEQLSSRRRGRYHRAAAESIERLPEQEQLRRVAEVSYHFRHASLPARAFPYAMQAAAQAAAVYANVEAERHYQAALELARAIGDKAHEGEALERLGLLHWWNTGDYGAAMTFLGQAVVVYRWSGSQEGEVRAAAQLARAYARCGQPNDALMLLTPLLDGLQSAGMRSEQPAVEAGLLTALSDVHFHAGSYREQLIAAERAVHLWRASGDLRSLADALDLHGIALRLLGHWEDGLHELQEVVSIGERAEQMVALYSTAHAWYHISYSYLQSGDLEAAASAINRAVEVGEQLGNVSFYGAARFVQGLHAYCVGDWSAARQRFDEATSVLEGKPYITRIYSPIGQGLLSAATGEIGLGLRLLRGAVALGEQSQFGFALRRAQRELAEVELVIGRAAEVKEWLEPIVNEPGREDENDVTPLVPLLAWACIELGDEAAAEQHLDRAARQAEAHHHRLARLDVLRVTARLRCKQNRWHEAEAALEQALALCRTMSHPYAEAKALYCWGQLDEARGAPEQAHERYQQARSICMQLGEGLYLKHIDRALAGETLPDSDNSLAL